MECVQQQGTAAICRECDSLCMTTKEKQIAEQLERQRRRPLRAELGTVLGYPLGDAVAYLLMLATLLSRITGLSIVSATLIGAAFSAAYVAISG